MDINNNSDYFTEKIAPKKPAAENSAQDKQDKQDKQDRQDKQDKPAQKPPRRDRPRRDRNDRNDRSERTDRSDQPPRQNHPKPHKNAPAAEAAPEGAVTAPPEEDSGARVEIIGIRFKDVGKVYYFSPNGVKFRQGEMAVVETARGVECGEIVLSNRSYPERALVSPLKSIIRKADENDIKQLELNLKKEKEIMRVFSEKIEQHKLDMKPIDVDCTFDGSKILFYFTSDGRVDFRELVKDLAAIYRTRIELRQIGVRDEAKMLGGLGICGRPFCCSSFLGEFQPVSIKMAKEQSLSLNPTKISGTCGRLMCCLKYEQDCYEEFLRTTPKVGAYVETAEGRGVVDEVNLLTGMLKVKLDKKPDVPMSVNKSEVKLIKDGQIRVNRDEIKALRKLEEN